MTGNTDNARKKVGGLQGRYLGQIMEANRKAPTGSWGQHKELRVRKAEPCPWLAVLVYK